MAECPFCGSRVGSQDRNCPGCGGAVGSLADDQSTAPVSTSSSRDEQEIVDLARHNKIGAIKRYRETRGVGLAEAKQAVEDLMHRHGIIAGPRKPLGCASALLIVFAGLAFVTVEFIRILIN